MMGTGKFDRLPSGGLPCRAHLFAPAAGSPCLLGIIRVAVSHRSKRERVVVYRILKQFVVPPECLFAAGAVFPVFRFRAVGLRPLTGEGGFEALDFADAALVDAIHGKQ